MSDVQDRIEITQDGETREIFMSFGLLNEVTTLMGEPATAASVYFAPKLREQVLLAALHKRTKTGKVEAPIGSLDDVEISMSDMEALLAWEVDHAIGFFTRSMDRVVKLKGDLESLNQGASSLNGSPVSPSKKQSSGR
ncbi:MULTISPECIES: hypothetical protein [unclassified Mesorhizobium]|uniref:hypothetical protein n=1 Tax=unclassified Mesorhizobium TaxID=325217 RepID=UPI00112B633B|nr:MULTISPECIES: hypothetical protein [unclassified Mesorhizobium]TPL42617.1 hypothetical protein FJ961_07975 [Mesorhizobium sp. B2-4-5]TPL66620.1 hypothetical protein FJ949_09655 [Mesorhizobium sp. B2-4-1]